MVGRTKQTQRQSKIEEAKTDSKTGNQLRPPPKVTKATKPSKSPGKNAALNQRVTTRVSNIGDERDDRNSSVTGGRGKVLY